MKQKILITPRSFPRFKHKAYPLLEAAGYEIVENTTGRTLTEEELLGYTQENVVGIIVGVDPLPGHVLRQFKQLKAISKYGVGLDNIDLDTAEKLGIKVTRAVGTNNVSVAELTIALMFALARHIPHVVAGVKAGGWTRVAGVDLAGPYLGVGGFGQIGQEVAKRAKGLLMDVIAYSRSGDDQWFAERGVKRCDSLEELLSTADVVSLHVPATPQTKHMINAESLKLMKPSALLLNTSRGELIDEEALYEALVSKTIAGAASDVFSSEPPQPGEKLLTLDNFLLTAHIGALTDEAGERMVMVSTNNLLESLS